MYTESMAGATAKSTPKASKTDERELARLHKQNYWLRISQVKLVMDLIFVCTLKNREVQQLANVMQPMIYSTSRVQETQ